MEFIQATVYELTGMDADDDAIRKYDNPDFLFDYYWGLSEEAFDGIEYDPEFTDEEEELYENYWNGLL